MKKRVEISSIDSRVFVKELLALGKLGATLPDNAGVFKGMMLRAQVEVDENVLVKENVNVRVIPNDKGRLKDNVRQEAKKTTARKTAAKKEELKDEALTDPSESTDSVASDSV